MRVHSPPTCSAVAGVNLGRVLERWALAVVVELNNKQIFATKASSVAHPASFASYGKRSRMDEDEQPFKASYMFKKRNLALSDVRVVCFRVLCGCDSFLITSPQQNDESSRHYDPNVNVIHLLVTAKTANGICRHKFGDANVMCVGLARCCYFI